MPSFRNVGCRVLVCTLLVASVNLGSTVHAASKKRKADDGDRPYWRTNLFKRVFTDQKFLLTRWWPKEIKDPLFASTLGAGLAMVIQSGSREGGGQDVSWESGISGSASSGVKGVSHGFTRLGNGTTVAAILGITYLSSRRAHDDRLSQASSLAGESLLDAGIWIVVLKSVTARVRPGQSEAGSFFQYGSQENGSFPSGHAMGAFAVASVFAESYRDKKWVPWLSYGLATLVGVSRLELGRHFPGDVVVGAVLGTSIGRGVVARSGEEDAPRMRGNFGPVVGPEGRGVGVGWSYSWK
jgi:membrane-associated phospholipid phosphatase